MQSRCSQITKPVPQKSVPLQFGLLGVAGILVVMGCTYSTPQRAVPTDPPREITAGATGEISGTYASYGQLEGGLAVVVWSDMQATRSGSGTTNGRADFQALHRGDDGREIRWSSRVAEDGEGTVTVNGGVFDLADGRLLLATVVSGRPVVQQLDYDIEEFSEPELLESLRGWLETESQVRQFFDQSAASAPSDSAR